MSLDGKVALITGGTGALGRAVTAAFLEAGAAVAVSFVVDREVPECKGCLGAKADAPLFLKANVTVEAEVQTLVQTVTQRFGRIDILLSLVGGYVGDLPVVQLPEATWDHMMNLNLKTTFLCCKHVVPVMRRGGGGRIVTVSSRAALKVFPGISAYAVSKAGILTFTETLASEVMKDNITVNAILPSVIDTPANRKAMPGADYSLWVKPEEIARVVLFLCSDASREISAAAIPIYGRA
ncbi:MAG TPA: SDR family NAD(P)-dependent oxidoreductase [Candidatus Methylomirabilis sp.]|nr:SDR family NAD(P)-dependent oxidoreductase [Candidatus Methylomirabilis sp.]